MSNLFAYTAIGVNYPEYISVNLDEHQNAVITVRGRAQELGFCGPTAEIVLSPKELYKLAEKLYAFACTGNA